MSEITLILSRTPLHEFILSMANDTNREFDGLTEDQIQTLYRRRGTALTQPPNLTQYSGRWGSLCMIRGPKIYSVKFLNPAKYDFAMIGPVLNVLDALGQAFLEPFPVGPPPPAPAAPPTPPSPRRPARASNPANPARAAAGAPAPVGPPPAVRAAGNGAASAQPETRVQFLRFANRPLALLTDDNEIEFTKEYTSMERYRTNSGGLQGRWIMLHPKDEPYGLTFDPGNPTVAGLRPGHNGNCIRIHGGNPGAEQGILIHEAPNVGWLTGCISPRPKDNHGVFDNADGNPSYVAMDEIMTAMNSYARGRGSLFVMV
jgi:hypothetical protein